MDSGFFQFPISALSCDPIHNWITIVDLACLRCGQELLRKMSVEGAMIKAQDYLAVRPNVQHGIGGRREQLALVLGYDTIGVNVHGGSMCERVKQAEILGEKCRSSPFPLVRIKSDFLWKTFTPDRVDSPMSVREFLVLCAVYAAVGNKTYAKASLQMLRRYAAGYPKEQDFQAALLQKGAGSTFLSVRQLRKTLDDLEANGFFAKFTFNRGECFYSNRLSRQELREAVEKRKLRKVQTVATFRSLDQAASQRIAQLRKDAQAPYAIKFPA